MIEQFRHPNAWVEILVLAVAYYAVLTFIRGTRGAPVLKGLVVVFIVAFLGFMYLADVLGLPHLKLLLQWILSGSAIALLIIFAPELRRAMQHVAQSPLLLPLLRPASTAAVSEIANAAVKLSKSRIGALLAIERDVGLNEYVEKGCRIDAALTSDLLETIFFPGSALHDGAIVVRGDRVAAAGCLFPLTDDMSLSKSIGTRHRAALGISEETDAVAVVVSEETGRISVAVDGRLTVDLTRDQLVKLLGELASRSSQPGASLPPLDIAVEIDTKAVTRPAPPPGAAEPTSGNGREDAPKRPGSGTHIREFLGKEEDRP
ncbi:MAG TPA: diadenylate cyclase CdaA [Planctomycetota bacterium]